MTCIIIVHYLHMFSIFCIYDGSVTSCTFISFYLTYHFIMHTDCKVLFVAFDILLLISILYPISIVLFSHFGYYFNKRLLAIIR